MAEVTMYAKPLSGTAQTGLGSVVRLVTRQFLEPKHYRQLHRTLAEKWSHCHSLTAAVKLMEAHGVRITPEQEAQFAQMPEDRMIEALVSKMPQQTREQFEHFFLQLSFIASTTTRLRQALENGQPEVVEEALESAENVGVLPYLMKMAIAQAGQEVKASSTEHENWLSETETKMSPLLQAASALMTMQKELQTARDQLAGYQGDSKDKGKSVLLRMAAGNEQALLGSVVQAWGSFSQRAKRELEIRKEYEQEINEANGRLFEFKSKQIANVKNVLQRTAAASEGKSIMECLLALRKEAAQEKKKQELLAMQAEVEEKTKACALDAQGKAHKVLMRMNAGNDHGLQQNAWAAWKQAIEDEKKEKEVNDAVKQAEGKINEFMKKQSEGAKSVLTRMTMSNDSGLLTGMFGAWKEVWTDEKKAAEMEAELHAKSAKFGAFGSRNKGSAMSATERAAYLLDLQMVTCCFCLWKREYRCETMRLYGKEKNERRKRELIGVKGLFKDFASNLETTLNSGTPRVEDVKGRSHKGRALPSPSA